METGRPLFFPQDFPVLLDGLGNASAKHVDVGQQLAGLGAFRLIAQGLPVFHDGLIQKTFFLVQNSQIAVNVSSAPFQEDRLLVRTDGLIVPAGRHVGVAQLLQGLQVSWLFLEGRLQLGYGLAVIAGLKVGVALAHLLHELHGTVLAGEKVFVLRGPEVALSFIRLGQKEMDPLVPGVHGLETFQLGKGLVRLVGIQVKGRHAQARIRVGAVDGQGLEIFLSGLVVHPLPAIDIGQARVEGCVVRKPFQGLPVMVHRKGIHLLFGVDAGKTLVVAGVFFVRERLCHLQGRLVVHPLLVIDIAQIASGARERGVFLQACPVLLHCIVQPAGALMPQSLDVQAGRPVGTELQRLFLRLLPFFVSLFFTESIDDLSRLGAFARQAEGPVKTEAQGSKERNRQYRSLFHRHPRILFIFSRDRIIHTSPEKFK